MLAEKINQDHIEAMKAKDSVRSSTLSFLRAQLKNLMIEKKQDDLEDPEVIAVIKKQVKQRQDSIEQFNNGGREDLAAKEEKELVILKAYLPEEMSAQALQPIVDAAVKESGATGMKDMGQVMKLVVPQVAGKADNKMVSTLVREALAKL